VFHYSFGWDNSISANEPPTLTVPAKFSSDRISPPFGTASYREPGPESSRTDRDEHISSVAVVAVARGGEGFTPRRAVGRTSTTLPYVVGGAGRRTDPRLNRAQS
jgi:hypothetical protein